MLKIQEYVDIKSYSTFKIGGQFRYFTEISQADELPLFYTTTEKDEKYKNMKIFPLGGGSNCVFSDGVIDVIALKINIKGFDVSSSDTDCVNIKVGAGELLDEIVEKTILMNLKGMESLSAIPGTIGATPVQNVGAYGTEVKDIIDSVEVFDINEKQMKLLSNSDCKFGYRDSIFKNEVRGRYVITGVVFRLKKTEDYTSLLKKREEIINTRWSKLPKPEDLPNVGSFFKNPIVQKEIADKILKEYPLAKFFPVDESKTKVPAGWLIENAELKGKSFGRVATCDKNALILINTGGATKEDVLNAKNEIIKKVQEKFGITLEQEPEVI